MNAVQSDYVLWVCLFDYSRVKFNRFFSIPTFRVRGIEKFYL